jgi:hypothetical protein
MPEIQKSIYYFTSEPVAAVHDLPFLKVLKKGFKSVCVLRVCAEWEWNVSEDTGVFGGGEEYWNVKDQLRLLEKDRKGVRSGGRC